MLQFVYIREMFKTNTLLASTCFILVSANTAFAKNSFSALADGYKVAIEKMENHIKNSKRDFRFVTTTESFPERINASETLYIETSPSGALATLHDFRTGQPLETCRTPCTLHREPNWQYAVFVYKYGYIPIGMHNKPDTYGNDEIRDLYLGMNFFNVLAEHKKCAQKYSKSPKTDSAPQPCYRSPPRMPGNAKTSGYCKLVFDLTKSGRPVNIKATYCTSDVFESSSKATLKYWRYMPKTERGSAVPAQGLETKIKFQLSDEDGNIIPIPE